MNWFEKGLYFLEGTMRKPQAYGWYHLMCIGLVIVAVFLLCRFARNVSERGLSRILLIFGLCCIVLEVYKQLSFSYEASNDTWDYQWYAFPFQFCDSPIYSAILAGLLPKGRVRGALLTYLATYGLLAGLLVLAYPGDVFSEQIGINIHTMFQHGGQTVIGLYLLITRKYEQRLRSILGAVAVFCSFVAVALALDVIVYNTGLRETFNLFYISPYFPSSLPVYAQLYGALPYPVFLILYIIPFSLAAWAIFAVRGVIGKRADARRLGTAGACAA